MPQFRGRTQEVCQIRLAGVLLTRVYTVIPLKEQTPQLGQNEWAQVQNFSSLHMEKFHTLRGQTRLSVYTQQKMRCQTPHLGSNPAHLEEHKWRVRPRNRGRWIPFTLRGNRRGLTPHLGFNPAIGALCKSGNRMLFAAFATKQNFRSTIHRHLWQNRYFIVFPDEHVCSSCLYGDCILVIV